MANDFHSLSDEQLIEKCKIGNNEAYNILISRYLFAIRARASAYEKSSIGFDDLVQEGFIGLVNAVNCYDAEFGTSFSTFAYLCIDRNILSAVKKTLSKKQIPKSALIFIEDNTDFESDKSDNPENVVISKESYENLKNGIYEKLSLLERNVLNLYLNGYSYQQIGEKLKIPLKSVDNAIQRIRKKLK